jgi:hypothetical protein
LRTSAAILQARFREDSANDEKAWRAFLRLIAQVHGLSARERGSLVVAYEVMRYRTDRVRSDTPKWWPCQTGLRRRLGVDDGEPRARGAPAGELAQRRL